MRKRIILIIIFSTIALIIFLGIHISCLYNNALNKNNFEEFEYNGNSYILLENNENFEYSLFGDKHLIGHTLGNMGRLVDTYILDMDVEENFIFQEYGYIWIKKDYILDTNNLIIKSFYFHKIIIGPYENNTIEYLLNIDDVKFSSIFAKVDNIDKETMECSLIQLSIIYENGLQEFLGYIYYDKEDRIYIETYPNNYALEVFASYTELINQGMENIKNQK